MAFLLKPTGEIVPITPANGAAFTLAELQGFVGGYIEIVRAPPLNGQPFRYVINEDGKRLNLPDNALATLGYWYAGGSVADWIVGNVVAATFEELGEHDDKDDDDDDETA